ncbi:MAG: cysteine--tRNA ligase [Candidatus Saccharibacteria bacterium]
MTLKFYNTLTGHTDEFVSQVSGKVSLYTCGPTVYDSPHVGNWASYIYWDTLVRLLMVNEYEVKRVMNITDVGHLTSDADEGEDKLEKGARREHKTAWEVAKQYTDEFMEGMNELNLIIPQYITKATDYIPDQLNLIKILKDKGFTYQIDDGIYFETSKFPSYADFAHLDLENLKAGARVEYNPEKHSHSDFALWKFTAIGAKRDMEWETPRYLLDNDSEIKMGFPGWAVECSAMALTILGSTIDIHTGGIDHIPVHHTNEIAQSESVTGQKFCNYWLHNDHIKVNGTKISKSIGNGYKLSDLKSKGFTPIDFRMFVLQGNYRNESNFTFEGLQSAKNRLNNWRNISAIRHQINDTTESEEEINHNETTVSLYATPRAIIEALDEDIGTPEALRIIDEAFSRITRTSLNKINKKALIQLLELIDYTLGLKLIENSPDITDDAKRIIIERNAARSQQNWQKADELRDQLLKLGVLLRDTEKDSIWEYLDK